MRLCFVFADSKNEWNCSQHNCINPANAINKTGVHQASYMHISEFVQNSPETQKIISESDAVIIERNIFQDTLLAMLWWKLRGHDGLITIFDDGYHCMNATNPAYDFWHNSKVRYTDPEGKPQEGTIYPHVLDQLRWGIQMSKGLQTVSQALCDYWKPVNDTYLIHNHLVIENYLNVKQPLYPHDGLVIGWSGSLSHVDSFIGSGLLKAFKNIVTRFKDVRILITGEKRTFDLLEVPATRKMFSPFVPPDKYPALVKSFDIYTIPLSGDYDRCRSQIKPLECAGLKTVFLATNYPNYSHLAPYGNFTDNGEENWTEKLTEMIENLPKYQEKANEVAFPFALTQNIDLHVQERIDLYQKLIDKPYK